MAILSHRPRIFIASALIVLASLSACGQQATIDPYATARADLQYQADVTQQQTVQARAAVLEPIVRISLGTLLLIPVIIVGVGLDAWRLRRRLIAADASGKLPMPRSVVESDPRPAIAALGAFHATALAHATPGRLLTPPSAPALITSRRTCQPLGYLTAATYCKPSRRSSPAPLSY